MYAMIQPSLLSETTNDSPKSSTELPVEKGLVEVEIVAATDADNSSNNAKPPEGTSGSKKESEAEKSPAKVSADSPHTSASPGPSKPTEPEAYSTETSDAAQEKFDAALRCSCLLSKPDELYAVASVDVSRLGLPRALPHTINLADLVSKLKGLQVSAASTAKSLYIHSKHTNLIERKTSIFQYNYTYSMSYSLRAYEY